MSCGYYCYMKTRGGFSFKKPMVDRIKLVVFDMDGVVVDVRSSWGFIHDYFDVSNNKSVDAYLRGKIDDLEFIRRDVGLWMSKTGSMKKSKLLEILSDVPMMKGAEKCVKSLWFLGVKTAIISAGVDVLADRVGRELGVDYVFANGVGFDDEGYITGEGVLRVRLMYKDEVIFALSKKLGVSPGEIASVGNSCFDIPMFKATGLSVAFNPVDDCTLKAADEVVRGKDLSLILPVIKRFICDKNNNSDKIR